MKKKKKQISISDLSLKEKIAQMIIIGRSEFDPRFLKLGIVGIFIGRLNSKEEYKKFISHYQKNSKIKLFISADVEGYQTPFNKFYKSKSFGEIKNKKQAYNLGKDQGKIMRELGFNLNFSPVVEVRNIVWPGRSFHGNVKEIKEKIRNYIKGLHEEKILATAKHYPGGSLIKDPHLFKFKTKIPCVDLELFDESIKSKTDFIMIGHPIVYGIVDSKGKQCTISPEIIYDLKKKFQGIIITDAITMLGLKKSYTFSFNKIYLDLISAGNDIILDTNYLSTFNKVLKRIKKVEKAVKKGKISEQRINQSVKKILEMKGYEVI